MRLRAKGTRLKMFVLFGRIIVGALARSLRYRIHDPMGWYKGERRREPKIWACWHGQQLIFFHFFRGRGTGILSSLHGDGDLSSGIMRRLGWRIVRGSTTKGAVSGLLELLRYLRSGGELALTPDGPNGPLHHVEPGILFLAAKTGAPIIPIAMAAKPAWHAPSWDRFLVPWPFARCAVYFSDPFRVREEELRESQPHLQKALAAAIHRANRGAERLLAGGGGD